MTPAAHCKGIAVNTRLTWVEEHHGEAGLSAVLGALSPEQRKMIDGRVLPHAWVPIELFIALNVAADQQFGKGDLALCVTMGAWAAEKTLPRVFKIFYRFGSPMFIFEKAAKLWSAHYDSGRLDPRSPAPDQIVLSLHDFATPHRAHCLSVLGWATKSIELSGGRVLAADERACRTRGAKCCELALSWK